MNLTKMWTVWNSHNRDNNNKKVKKNTGKNPNEKENKKIKTNLCKFIKLNNNFEYINGNI